VAAQAFLTPRGRRLLLANKRDWKIAVPVADVEKAGVVTVDAQTGDGPARALKPVDSKITLEPFAVTVVSW
jgi:hypothetical protein